MSIIESQRERMSLKPIYVPKPDGRPAKVVALMSGTGTNVVKIIEHSLELRARRGKSPFEVCAIVTDRPESNAEVIGMEYGIPTSLLDIRRFYEERGEYRVTLKTAQGRRIRKEWDEELERVVFAYRPDFCAFGGFIPLTNLVAKILCLNVHPGDLSYEREGRRYLVGLHAVPIKKAILGGLPYLRSSVIQAIPYTASGEDMDAGPIFAISKRVPVELPPGETADTLGSKPDLLERIAADNLRRLKEEGDWSVLPKVVEWVSEGRYSVDDSGVLHFDGHPVPFGVDMDSLGQG
ncbi:MAG: hypothetical protein ACUVXI_00125 [bacterium]